MLRIIKKYLFSITKRLFPPDRPVPGPGPKRRPPAPVPARLLRLFGGLLSLLLPETLGIPLMASLDDLDGISARTKPFFAWWTRAQLRESLERNAEIKMGTAADSPKAHSLELPSQ